MIKKLVTIIASLLPLLAFSQSNIWDPKNRDTLEEHCDGKVFDKVEVLPSLSVSAAAYGDSLNIFLRQRGLDLRGKTVKVSFIVTSRSKIFNLTTLYPDLDEKEDLKAAILNFSNLWIPARQNSHIVCSYVNVEMSFTKKLRIRIYQYDSR
jgi:hypothetical protein